MTSSFKTPTKVFKDYIELPCPQRNGEIKVYRIESVPAETGIFVQEMFALALAVKNGAEVSDADRERLKLDDEQEVEFNKDLLGDTYDEMIKDGVSWEVMKTVISVVMVWTAQNLETAIEVWETEMVTGPKPPPNRAERRASAKSTKKQGSRAGTTKKKTAPVASDGGNSSDTGN